MKALKTTILVTMLMTIVMAWAQNGAPQQIWSQIVNLFDDNHNSYNVVVVEDNIFFTANIGEQAKLVQMNKYNHQIGWQRNLGYNSGFGFITNQLVVSNDYNLAIVDSGFVVRKISAQNGQEIWLRNLYGSPVQTWTIHAVSDYLICRGNRGGLTLLNWQDGQIISQMETTIPYLNPQGVHPVFSQNGQNLYLSDICLDGENWNTAWRVTKITVLPDSNIYQQNWQIHFIDETFPITIESGANLYIKSTHVDSSSNTTIKLRRVDPASGQIIWTQDIGEPNEFSVGGLIDNGDNIIAYGLHFGDYRPIMVNYNPAGIQTWAYSAPFPEGGFPYAIYRAAVWDGNNLILTGKASQNNQVATNARVWLSAVATSVENDDPTTPATPDPELICYPNPFSGSTTVKFNQVENSPTTISIYNIKGQLIRTLINNQKLSSGEHSIPWDGKTNSGQPTAAGIYYYKMTSGRYSSTKKMIMMK